MKKWSLSHVLPPLLLIFFSLLSPSLSRDTITIDSPLTYNDTLESPDGIFTLGFFTPGNSNSSYLGIWYTNTKETIVWVANRDIPMLDTTGVLSINTESSNLQLQNKPSEVVWYVNFSNMVSPITQLLNTGNFVLVDKNTNNPAWQSFDYPTDTLLPGMKFGWIAGRNHHLISWTSWNNPSSSNYTTELIQSAWPEPEIHIRNGSKLVFRSGPWDGTSKFSGVPIFDNDTDFTFNIVSNQNETYVYTNSNPMTKLVLNNSSIQRYVLIDSGWTLHWSVPNSNDSCDNYAKCGPFGVCNLDSSNYSNCTCLNKFVPIPWESESKEDDTSKGCSRRVGLTYTEKDGFLPIKNVKLPDTKNVTVDSTIGLKKCKKRCLMNRSCTAYSSLNGESGCAMWMVNLTDMRKLDNGGWTVYYRVSGSEVPATSTMAKKIAIPVVCVILGLLIWLLILASVAYLIRKKLANQNENLACSESHGQFSQESVQPFAMSRKEILEEGSSKGSILNLPIFDASVILAATKNFALSNKLGEGGFGTVFKGELEGGERVAVKRLSYSSTQGLSEFKNEVMLITELQHINLVRLLGCCIEGEERMLIYEYMENTSLDTILFDKAKSSQLDWRKRFEIIMGIARGILYLHQDSRLQIIHRDLKASNVLLDENMNPKISDFGIARIFGRHEKDIVTNRVVGTYGYMSPEYAMYGIFSVKSDVFSFGVLVLEIISGMKICEIFGMQPSLNLLNYAWTLWNDGKALKLVNTSIPMNSRNKSQIIRCTQVGLLCVQDNPEDRPHMSEAILMLNSPNMILPQPKQPAYFSNKAFSNMESTSSCTACDTSITVVEPR